MQPDNQKNQIPPPPKQVVDVIANPAKPATPSVAPKNNPDAKKSSATVASPTEQTKKLNDTKDAEQNNQEPSKYKPKKKRTTPVFAIIMALIIASALIGFAIYLKLEPQTTTSGSLT